MNLVSYFNPDTLERDNNGQLGLATETITKGWQFFPIGSEEFEVYVNGHHGIKSFSLQIDIGSCTFSKEFRKSGDRTQGYWYASKKFNDELKRVYFGRKAFTTENLQEALEKLDQKTKQPGSVTQENNCVTLPGCLELAGHGKSEKHLQPNLIPVNQEIAMLRAEVEHLKGYIKQQTNSHIVLGEELRSVQRDRLAIIKERDAIAKDLLVYSTQYRNHSLGVLVAQERMKELEHTLEMQANLIKTLREEATKYHNELEQERWESSRREDQVAGYYFMHEELSEQVFKYRTLIEKYRLLAKGKDKRNHPRYAYMIDFLSEIDNLSL